MADTNTYESKQNIKKYTTQAKFDSIDKSDIPVGTEYNIVGEIEESDLSAELQSKISSLEAEVAALKALLNQEGYSVVLVKN